MTRDIGDHRHVGRRPRQDRLVDPRHVVGHEREKAGHRRFRHFVFQGNDDAQTHISVVTLKS
jgi:hypothetical protein